MKKIALALVALTAFTGAALANDRTEEGTAASRHVAEMQTESVGAAAVAAPRVVTGTNEPTEFALIKRYGIEHDSR